MNAQRLGRIGIWGDVAMPIPGASSTDAASAYRQPAEAPEFTAP